MEQLVALIEALGDLDDRQSLLVLVLVLIPCTTLVGLVAILAYRTTL